MGTWLDCALRRTMFRSCSDGNNPKSWSSVTSSAALRFDTHPTTISQYSCLTLLPKTPDPFRTASEQDRMQVPLNLADNMAHDS